MSVDDDRTRMQHMLDHAREAISVMAGYQRDDLNHNRILQLALVRLIEIVGEASTKISETTRSRWSNIPWREIAGMRNRLIHGYDRVDLRVLWDTLECDLPALVVQLEQALISENKNHRE